MKKYFLMAIMAATTLSFLSCEKKDKEEQGGGDQPAATPVVVLSDDEFDLPLGYKYQLSAVLSPAKDIAISWISTNTKAVEVDEEGWIYGIAEGTAKVIASAEGYKSDTCVVNVVDPYTQFGWAGCEIWNFNRDEDENPIILNPNIVNVPLTSGDSVPCVLASAYALLWSQGMDFNETSGWTGSGYLSILDVPVYMIAAESGPWAQYNGYYITIGGILIVDPKGYNPADTAYVCCAPAAQLIDPEKHYAYITGQGDEEGITGSTVEYIDWAAEEEYAYEALLGEGVYVFADEDFGQIMYNSIVYWSDGFYGLALNAEGTAFKEPLEFANFKGYQYKYAPSSAPAKAPMHRSQFVKVNKQNNAVRMQNIKKLANEKKINSLRGISRF